MRARLSIAIGALGALDAAVAIVERTSDGRHPVVAVNPSFPALLNQAGAAILGKPWREVVGATGKRHVSNYPVLFETLRDGIKAFG